MPRAPLVSLILALRAAVPLAGQGVLVAPHAIYIDHARRSGTVTLYNPNPDPAEITIWTHKIDGLTESDFILAAKIDRL